MLWPEVDLKKKIDERVLDDYPDDRVWVWQGEIWELILQHTTGHINTRATAAEHGYDAWRRIKAWFEPTCVNF